MDWKDHIVATPDTCAGKSRIEGTRITVELVLDYLAAGKTEAEIIEDYPHLTVEQIRAAAAFAGSRGGCESMLIRLLDAGLTRP